MFEEQDVGHYTADNPPGHPVMMDLIYNNRNLSGYKVGDFCCYILDSFSSIVSNCHLATQIMDEH